MRFVLGDQGGGGAAWLSFELFAPKTISWNTPWCCSKYKLRQAGGRIRVIPVKHGRYFPMKTFSDAA
jgi:hypothetical protein